MNSFSIAIHGGAGTILKQDMTPELEEAYLKALDNSLKAGFAVLQKNGSAAEAVTAATIELEDNSLF